MLYYVPAFSMTREIYLKLLDFDSHVEKALKEGRIPVLVLDQYINGLVH